MEESSAGKAQEAQDVIADVIGRLDLDGHQGGEGSQDPAPSGEVVERFFVPADPGDSDAAGYELTFPDNPALMATMRAIPRIPTRIAGQEMMAETTRSYPDDGSNDTSVEDEVADEGGKK